MESQQQILEVSVWCWTLCFACLRSCQKGQVNALQLKSCRSDKDSLEASEMAKKSTLQDYLSICYAILNFKIFFSFKEADLANSSSS